MSTIGSIIPRERTTITGRVEIMRVRTAAHNTALLECVLNDGTGSIEAVFLGYRTIPGLHLGGTLQVDGVSVMWDYRLVMLNPRYTIIPSAVHA